MSEEKKPAQQEIAPIDDSVLSSTETSDATAKSDEQIKKKRRTFFSLPDPTKKAVYLAVFIALAVVIKFLAIDVFPGGKLSFFYLPVYLSGIFFGPVSGFIVGFLSDILGTVIGGKVPTLIVSFGNGLSGAIMGFFFMLRLKPPVKIILGVIACLFLVTLGINTYGLSSSGGNFSLSNYFAFLFYGVVIPRIIFQPMVLAVNTVILFPLYYVVERNLKKLLVNMNDF